jgi:hypothetical protein
MRLKIAVSVVRSRPWAPFGSDAVRQQSLSATSIASDRNGKMMNAPQLCLRLGGCDRVADYGSERGGSRSVGPRLWHAGTAGSMQARCSPALQQLHPGRRSYRRCLRLNEPNPSPHVTTYSSRACRGAETEAAQTACEAMSRHAR